MKSSGQRGRAYVWGSASVAAGDLEVFGDRLPPSSALMLFRGPEATNLPLGVGTLCIGGQTVRVDVRFADQDGAVTLPFDGGAPSLPSLLPGDTSRFQLWH